MQYGTQADGDNQTDENTSIAPSLRRSNRLASKTLQQTKAIVAMSGPRRNPKRKACEAADEVNHRINSGDELLNEALAPLSQEDIEEWEGWIELESEPAFFNIILRDLGVQNVKAQEIFTIDHESLSHLP
jgi:ubiquitin carboxyl-terminal hydrolase L5